LKYTLRDAAGTLDREAMRDDKALRNSLAGGRPQLRANVDSVAGVIDAAMSENALADEDMFVRPQLGGLCISGAGASIALVVPGRPTLPVSARKEQARKWGGNMNT